MEEYPCCLAKLLLALRGQILASATTGQHGLKGFVPVKVRTQAIGDILSLRYDAHTRRHMRDNTVHEQRVVGAAKNDCVDIRVFTQKHVYALLHEIVGSGTVRLASLND